MFTSTLTVKKRKGYSKINLFSKKTKICDERMFSGDERTRIVDQWIGVRTMYLASPDLVGICDSGTAEIRLGWAFAMIEILAAALHGHLRNKMISLSKIIPI